ncbi:MAG: ATP-binding protein, partial [Thermodesulfovibrionales bacterium]
NPEKKNEGIERLKASVDKYGEVFGRIEKIAEELSQDFKNVKPVKGYEKMIPLIKAIFLEQPILVAELFEKGKISGDSSIVLKLKQLHSNIQTLRTYGEDIITTSKELDGKARERVERTISVSQKAILIFFPLFLITGIGLLFLITGSVINRLRLLATVVERTGRGEFTRLPHEDLSDEVGILIKKFDEMEEELLKREDELKKKNEELLQSKKLAALGTLAAGVAHELNNPLNNIYISAQVLKRETTNMPDFVTETVDDIMAQSIRVKHIVSDLLEFARGREPDMRETDIKEIILGSYKSVSITRNTEGINFNIDASDEPIIVMADPAQMERVFINLFNNAIDAMEGKGRLSVTITKGEQDIAIKVSDTGKGIPSELLEKVFEPFYTTKDRGTGLGLAIVYNIIKKHGWEISVESKSKGTTFIITLPKRRL